MPVHIRHTESGKYSVSTPSGVKAKGTTKEKAEAQKRLLQGVEHGWKPTGKNHHGKDGHSMPRKRDARRG